MPKSRLVVITNHNIYDSDGGLKKDQTSELINHAMVRLTGTTDSKSAWKKIAKSGDRFGIKPNCLGGRMLCSSPVMADAIVSGLQSAGVRNSDIIIWERTNRELERSGYKLNYARNSGLRCFGTDSRGVGYSDSFHQFGKVASLISKIFEQQIDKNINFPILKDHSVAGISGGLKNLYGLVHNPNKYHPDNCDPYAAEVSALPIVREKNILTILDMTKLQYNGGPGYVSRYLVKPGTVVMSFDPIAVDAYGYKIIEDYRRKNGLPSLKKAKREPLWLETGKRLGLGESDLSQVEIIEEDIN
jgi:uncharacterized protein (DUF362 family)